MESARVVDTAGGPVQVAELGDPQGSVVLTVHGSPGGYDQAVLMGRFLAAREFRVIAPSRPGYLGTPLDAGNADSQAQADLLVALLDVLGVDRTGVLAWSGGGPCGYRLAAAHSDRVSALVAFAALSSPYDWRISRSDKLFFGTLPGELLLEQMIKHQPARIVSGTLSSTGDLTETEVATRTTDILADPERLAFVLDLARSAVMRGRRHPGVANDQREFAAMADLDLRSISVPTLIVQGEADTEVLPDHSEFAHQRIQGSQLLSMPGGTHLALFVDPGYQQAQQQVIELFDPRIS